MAIATHQMTLGPSTYQPEVVESMRLKVRANMCDFQTLQCSSAMRVPKVRMHAELRALPRRPGAHAAYGWRHAVFDRRRRVP